VKQKTINIIGRHEIVDFPELNLENIEAKIDTGAYTSSIHCDEIYIKQIAEKQILFFSILSQNQKPLFEFEQFKKKRIMNSFGEAEERFVIKTKIFIGGKKIITQISLTNRQSMRYPVLIGRKLLRKKFIVDVDLKNTGGISFEKNKTPYLR
jgi:hypothetical protein